jgi:hypothetical protein
MNGMNSLVIRKIGVKIMLTKDIKKGDRFQLRNGWFGTMKDNGRGVSRLAEIEGVFTEIGSVYSFEIEKVFKGEQVFSVELTDKEKQVQRMNEEIFG